MKTRKINDESKSALGELNTIFTHVFGLTILAIILIQSARGNNNSEGPDKVIYLSGGAIVIFYYLRIFFFNKVPKKFLKSLSLASLIGLILGVGGIERHNSINGVNLADKLWLGFGPITVILMIALSFYIWQIFSWQNFSRQIKYLLGSFSIVICLFDFVSLWQDNNSVIDPNHSEYIMNEVLATSGNHLPFVDFIPQYQSMFTIFFAPFGKYFSASQITNLAFIVMFVLSIFSIILGALLVRNSLPNKSILFGLAIVIPLTCVVQFPIREGNMGSIATLLSGLPVRIFPGLFVLTFTSLLLSKESTSWQIRKFLFVLLGIFDGILVWHSQDFGIAAVVIEFIVLFLMPMQNFIKSGLMKILVLTGFAIGFSIYPVLILFTGRDVNFSYFGYFVRKFASGFGAESIRTPGPVLVIFPLIIALIVCNLFILRNYKSIETKHGVNLYYHGLVGLLFAGWSALSFTYYLNRSYASGQMQILFLPVSISLGVLVGSFIHLRTTTPPPGNQLRSKPTKILNLRNFAPNLLISSLVFSLPFASMLGTPNPIVEIHRIQAGLKEPSWPKKTILDSLANANSAKEFVNKNGGTLAYFGGSANFVEKETGVKSAMLFNSPYDATISQDSVNLMCGYIRKLNPDYLVVGEEGTKLFVFKNKTLCETYFVEKVEGIKDGYFAKRIA